MMQHGLFDCAIRFDQLDAAGDPLATLKTAIDWEAFRCDIEAAREAMREDHRKSPAGRKPFDAVLMFKILIIRSLYNLGDDAMEYQIRDRLSFMRFLDLSISDPVPDAKTIWLFRETLTRAGVVRVLFDRFDGFLRDNGFSARKGQIVDASIVSVPRQRNSRQENAQIKATSQPPDDWDAPKHRQKDTDARWTKKNGTNYYGYKNHISIDVKHKFVRGYAVTDAAVHDSNIFEELLDEHNSSCDVWADSAYRSQASLAMLESRGHREHLQRKGYRNKPMTEREKRGNHTRSKTRARVEHVFGVQAIMAGSLLVRAIGKLRVGAVIGLRNLAYNLHRFSRLQPT